MPAPFLEVLGPAEITVSEAQQVSLLSRASQPNTSCPAAAATFERIVHVAFRWALLEGPPVDFSVGTLATTATAPTLVIPSETLQAGYRCACDFN